jgi:hypothetical protein
MFNPDARQKHWQSSNARVKKRLLKTFLEVGNVQIGNWCNFSPAASVNSHLVAPIWQFVLDEQIAFSVSITKFVSSKWGQQRNGM